MGDDDIVKTLNVYYCTEHGKVKGQLQISQSRIFFDPQECEENKDHGKHNLLRKFEVCIDMGDVISVQKKTLINESGSYVADPDGLKAYMYDFFLQIDLASVNRKKNFNMDGEAEDESDNEDDGSKIGGLQPSFINTHLGASFCPNDGPDAVVQPNVIAFLQSQALDELAKARPVATVFFRFSHRDDENNFLLVHKQKNLVNEVRTQIIDCQKEHTARLVEDVINFGIDTVKSRVSQTFLDFFDVYSIIDQ